MSFQVDDSRVTDVQKQESIGYTDVNDKALRNHINVVRM